MGSNNATYPQYVTEIIPTAGALSGLRVKLSVAPGAGKSRTISIYLNGSAQLTVTIADTATTGVNTGSVNVSAGDTVAVVVTATGTPATTAVYYSSIFTGTTSGESILMGNSYSGGMHTTTTLYGSVANCAAIGATEADYKSIIPTPGTIKKFYWKLDADPGTSPDAYRATLRKVGSSQALTSTITANDITGNDTANSFTVAAGDSVTLMFEPLNSPAAAPRPSWGMVFVADTDGESIILGGSTGALSNSVTQYNIFAFQGSAWSGTETFFTLLNACTLKKFYVELSGSPKQNHDTDDWYQLDVRIDAANSGVVAKVMDGGTGNMVANDTAHEATITDGQTLSLRSLPNSSPTARDAYWGVVCYVSSGYKLTPSSGSFAETGTAASLKATRKLTVASRSFTETGTAATLTYGELTGYTLTAAGGAYTESGTAAVRIGPPPRRWRRCFPGSSSRSRSFNRKEDSSRIRNL